MKLEYINNYAESLPYFLIFVLQQNSEFDFNHKLISKYTTIF